MHKIQKITRKTNKLDFVKRIAHTDLCLNVHQQAASPPVITADMSTHIVVTANATTNKYKCFTNICQNMHVYSIKNTLLIL